MRTRGVDVCARLLCNILGTLFLLVVFLGVVLLLLPATPFLLVAIGEGDRGHWLTTADGLGGLSGLYGHGKQHTSE